MDVRLTRAMLWGTLRYEFIMQVRRAGLWITMGAFGLFLLGLALSHSVEGMPQLLSYPPSMPIEKVVIQWTMLVNYAFPMAAGVLMADRQPRDRRLKVDELLVATPAGLAVRLGGRYLGVVLATLAPILVVYAIGVGCIVVHSGDPQTLPLALAALAAIVLPAVLFVGAFALACPPVLGVPLYQFSFIGYWCWGNLIAPDVGIPTLAGTLLTPVGSYACRGFFGSGATAQTCPPVRGPATVVEGTESLLLLLAVATVVLVALWGYLRWRAAREAR
jgi:hypothetical protein